MKPIFLIGFMGAGKTTLGRALGERLPEWTYIDLDDYIESSEGMSVKEIFAKCGESAFRTLEVNSLHALGCRKNVIIGCGGGTPCFGDNMEWMNSHGVTVLLEATLPTLLRRLLEAQAQRPLLAGMTPHQLESFIVSKQNERMEHYGKALYRFDANRLECEQEIEESCRTFIERFMPRGAN